MRFPLRSALALAPPFLAAFWWYGRPALSELRLRWTRDMVEVSGPQSGAILSAED